MFESKQLRKVEKMAALMLKDYVHDFKLQGPNLSDEQVEAARQYFLGMFNSKGILTGLVEDMLEQLIENVKGAK